MSTRTPAENLNKAIQRILTEYAEDVNHDVEAVAVRMGQRGAAALREKAAQTFLMMVTIIGTMTKMAKLSL